uniref:Uncharacterized protein n=1 Tax=Brassica oleracea TaxID=3712 RepID=A0A3P6F7K2_BRAOL|nr:unnamed protein product [Brassica oleracea]
MAVRSIYDGGVSIRSWSLRQKGPTRFCEEVGAGSGAARRYRR